MTGLENLLSNRLRVIRSVRDALASDGNIWLNASVVNLNPRALSIVPEMELRFADASNFVPWFDQSNTNKPYVVWIVDDRHLFQRTS
jgi:hypothetical protein